MKKPPREPAPEELMTLGIVQRCQGPFVLAPVLIDGVERYVLGSMRIVDGKEHLHVLAVCINADLDGGKIVDQQYGIIASPLRVVSSKN